MLVILICNWDCAIDVWGELACLQRSNTLFLIIKVGHLLAIIIYPRLALVQSMHATSNGPTRKTVS